MKKFNYNNYNLLFSSAHTSIKYELCSYFMVPFKFSNINKNKIYL